MYEIAEFDKYDSPPENPWINETDLNAPFNKEQYLILNNAVGGSNGFFPDQMCDKPYLNHPVAPEGEYAYAVNQFYDNKSKWYPSWNYPLTNDAAMHIDWIKVT